MPKKSLPTKAIVTAEEQVAIDAFLAAARNLPSTLRISTEDDDDSVDDEDDVDPNYANLKIWKAKSSGIYLCVGSLRKEGLVL